MSGYITRNALMTDNPTFGPPAQNPGWGVSNALTTATPTDAWGAPMNVQPAQMGIRPDATGTPGLPAIQPGMNNDDLMKALAQLYGGQAPGQQFQDARQQGMQSGYPITQSDRDRLLLQTLGEGGGYHGREGGGLV